MEPQHWHRRRRLAADQFESLVRHAFKARQFMLLDDPYLGRSKPQGYAWKAGKKTVVIHHPASGLTSEELDDIAKRLRVVRAEQALVFYPYPDRPAHRHPDVRVLSGKKLLAWFSVLDFVPPPLSGELPVRSCACGAPMKERINRSGDPLLVCGRYPDCRVVQTVVAADSGNKKTGVHGQKSEDARRRISSAAAGAASATAAPATISRGRRITHGTGDLIRERDLSSIAPG